MKKENKSNQALLGAIGKGYRVNVDGNVIYKNKRVLGGVNSRTGYSQIAVRTKEGPARKINIHRVQAYIKYGDLIFKEGIEVRHLNGRKADNSFDNIGIGTRRDNAMDIPEEQRMALSVYAASFLSKPVLAGNIRFESYKAAGRHFGLSDNGIRKRITLGWSGYENL